MEIERLVEHMKQEARGYRNGKTLGRAFADAEDVLDEAADILERLQAENERLNAQAPRWIPVEERLPYAEYGESDTMLCYTDMEVEKLLYFDGGNWCFPTGEAFLHKVTHWMPLPKPPKEGKKDD